MGRPHGFACETQGTLFFYVARIIAYHRPKAFVLENVKNLISHDKGNTFKVILSTLKEELGYDVHWKIIDARAWVPQHRERTFIVGFRESTNFDFNQIVIPAQHPSLKSILHPEDGSEAEEPPYTYGRLAKVSDKYTLTSRLWEYLQAHAAKHRAKGNGFGYGLFTPNDVARTLSARYYKDGSEILIVQQGKNPRRLTPRECARLMGFDRRESNKTFVIPVSDAQAYRQFGNAVSPPVARAIADIVIPCLKRHEHSPDSFLNPYQSLLSR
jgi:DNA (cytosine-5)-methyltransferase 1